MSADPMTERHLEYLRDALRQSLRLPPDAPDEDIIDHVGELVTAERVPVPPTKQWHNSRYAGQGIGSAGPFRVVIRTDRKTDGRYIELLHDDGAGGYGFTRRQATDLIPLLQAAIAKLKERA